MENFLIWASSICCCIGILELCRHIKKGPLTLDFSPVFFALYFIGILHWFLFGVSINQPSLFIPCALQLMALMTIFIKDWKKKWN